MISLEVRDGRIELEGYSEDATLSELRDAIERSRFDESLVTAFCAGCGRCCFYEYLPIFGLDIIEMRDRLGSGEYLSVMTLPEKPSIPERNKAIADFVRDHGFDKTIATLLYEYNVAEPVSYSKAPAGGCTYLRNGLCGNYPFRAYTCALYACTMGDELSALQERIVRQGVWHAYHVLGWVTEEVIEHNPFLYAKRYDDVRVAAFDVDLSEALEALFFYF